MVTRWFYRAGLILFTIENAAAAWLLGRETTRASSLQPILVSVNKVAAVLLGLAGAATLILFYLDLRSPRIYQNLRNRLRVKHWKWAFLVGLSLVLIESLQDLILLGSSLPGDYFPLYLIESTEIFYWAGLVSLQGIGLVVALAAPDEREEGQRGAIPPWLPLAVVAGLIALVVFSTGAGYIPNSVKIEGLVGNFANPNAPLLTAQVLILWLVLTLLWLGYRLAVQRWERLESIRSDLIALIVLWGGAWLLWRAAPLEPNYFVEAPRPPTYQNNPASDSIYYEIQAHRLLAGEGFAEDVQHPLYSFFLSGLHSLAGDHFEDIYPLQIALLAVTPFLFYKLTSLLSTAYGGWLAGGLFIIREYNGLLLADTITVSTVNLVMTEATTLLGVILAVYLMAAWLGDKRSDPALLVLIGALIGLLSLLRVEMLSLYFVFCLVLLIRARKKWRSAGGKILLLTGTVALLITPWMTRNYFRTGVFSLDKGKFLQRTLSRYRDQLFSQEEPSSILVEPAVGIPGEDSPGPLEKITRHTKNNLVGALLYLPSNHQVLAGADNFLKIIPEKEEINLEPKGYFSDPYLTNYVKSLPYWRQDWDGSISPQSFLPISLSVGVIAIGFWMVWNRNRLTALLPVLVLTLHSATYALFSRSGGRFVQVVDWVPLLYFAIGLSVVGQRVLSAENPPIPEKDTSAPRVGSRPGEFTRGGILVGIAICILISAALPAAELLLEPRYTTASLENRLESLGGGESAQLLDPTSSEASILYGTALYPGYYPAGKAVLDNRSGRVPPADIYRLVFYLVGMDNIWVSVPLAQPPTVFPHGSEVVILGRYDRDTPAYLEAGKHPYFLADQILLINQAASGEPGVIPVR